MKEGRLSRKCFKMVGWGLPSDMVSESGFMVSHICLPTGLCPMVSSVAVFCLWEG